MPPQSLRVFFLLLLIKIWRHFSSSETLRKRTTVSRKNSNSMTTWPSIPTIPAIQDFGLAKKLFKSSDRVLKKVDGTHGEVMPGRNILTNHIQRTSGWNILEGDWYSEGWERWRWDQSTTRLLIREEHLHRHHDVEEKMYIVVKGVIIRSPFRVCRIIKRIPF